MLNDRCRSVGKRGKYDTHRCRPTKNELALAETVIEGLRKPGLRLVVAIEFDASATNEIFQCVGSWKDLSSQDSEAELRLQKQQRGTLQGQRDIRGEKIYVPPSSIRNSSPLLSLEAHARKKEAESRSTPTATKIDLH